MPRGKANQKRTTKLKSRALSSFPAPGGRNSTGPNPQCLPNAVRPPDFNIHCLRHTAASLMISGGADVATVSGILGHAQVSTTLDIYTHAFDEKKREVSAEMQGRVGV